MLLLEYVHVHLLLLISLSISLSGLPSDPTVLQDLTDTPNTTDDTQDTSNPTTSTSSAGATASTTNPVSSFTPTGASSRQDGDNTTDDLLTSEPSLKDVSTSSSTDFQSSSVSGESNPKDKVTVKLKTYSTSSTVSSSQSSTKTPKVSTTKLSKVSSTTASSKTSTSQATTINTPKTSAKHQNSSQSTPGLTTGHGLNAIKIQGNKKKLSLSEMGLRESASTTESTSTKTSSKAAKRDRKKKKRRPKQNKKTAVTTTMTSVSKGDDMTSVKGPLTTAYPITPDATIHNVEAGVKPIVFAAAAAENKKSGGKKSGKKGAKKAAKAQGKKGEPGPKGPPGPKGAKGEPGDAAQSSMPMQAASSAVLTEHFGPDKDVIVPFDLKLIDLADNYDNTTGVFICTIPGVYVVSLYLMSHPGAKVNARVFINSRPIAALWADDSKNSGFYPSSSIQTVSRLAFGDQVYVMLVDGGYGESWVHANYNAFSLFLLYEDVFFK